MNSKERLDKALSHCEKTRHELLFSYGWISGETISAQWVRDLEADEMKKERISAFTARFGRFQDYLADKVLRLWLEVVGEHVGTALEIFSVAERAGILCVPSEQMVELRSIRNRLTHEYVENAEVFADDLNAAIQMTPAFLDALDRLTSHYRMVRQSG